MRDKTATELRLEAECEELRKKRERKRKEIDEINEQIKDIGRRIRQEWSRKAALEVDSLKAALVLRYGVSSTDPTFQKIFNIAWDRGHSCGLTEVSNYFDEMAELLPTKGASQ